MKLTAWCATAVGASFLLAAIVPFPYSLFAAIPLGQVFAYAFVRWVT